jgi:hypothetical protein
LLMIHDICEIAEKGYWQFTKDRNKTILKCGWSLGKIAWRAYGRR